MVQPFARVSSSFGAPEKRSKKTTQKERQDRARIRQHSQLSRRSDFTPEEKARWKPLLQRTWDSIAYDVIQVCGGNCSRADLIESVLDADRPVMFGDLTAEEYRVIMNAEDRHVRKMMKEFFPCNSYCL